MRLRIGVPTRCVHGDLKLLVGLGIQQGAAYSWKPAGMHIRVVPQYDP
jgi:hypothetical protein